MTQADDSLVAILIENEHGPGYFCSACGGPVDDSFPWEFKRWGYSRCPHCGRKLEVNDFDEEW